METITHATALAARACGLETVLLSSNGLHILAARVMSDASLSVEFDQIAQKEVDDFNKLWKHTRVTDLSRTSVVSLSCRGG